LRKNYWFCFYLVKFRYLISQFNSLLPPRNKFNVNSNLKIFITLFLIGISNFSVAQQHSFSHYKVEVFKGRPAKLRIKGNPLAEMYKTIITNTYYNKPVMKKRHGTTGLSFAGHYCFVYWGCGSNCQHGVIVDLRTGKLYDAPTASNLFVYKPWSRLLIVNRAEYKDNCAFCKPEYWVLNETKKSFIRIN
jgi:hypothetical protein